MGIFADRLKKAFGRDVPLKERLKSIGSTALSAVSGRALVYGAAEGVSKLFPEREPAKTDEELEQMEIQGQIKLNEQQGYRSDELGNVIGRIDEEPEQEPKEVQIEVKPTPPDQSDSFVQGIIHAENRGARDAGENLYEQVGPTDDLGKYQVSPETLKAWSPEWLGKKYTPEEFLKDPDAQEQFFGEFLKVKDRYNLTDEEAAVTWHRGWGELGTGTPETREERFRERLDELMKEKKSQAYLSAFRDGAIQ